MINNVMGVPDPKIAEPFAPADGAGMKAFRGMASSPATPLLS
jgi:hypothetical protein